MLELEPHNSVAYFNRGSTYDSLGMHDAAIADFSKALELDPGTSSSPTQDCAAGGGLTPTGGGNGGGGLQQHDPYAHQQQQQHAPVPWMQQQQHWGH